MTSQADMHRGVLLRAYLAFSYLFPVVANRILRKRLAKGKEHPERWPEKQGRRLAARPEGRLIWLHAVGMGEVLSLRGLILRMGARDPDLSFLVTSTTVASARVFAKNLPERTIHQFLPLDAPQYRRRFLDHFRPVLCIWAEQDLWPGLVSDLAARNIPQVIVAARMNGASFARHQRAARLYRDLFGAMAFITAQDAETADHITQLGAARVPVTGSLKPAAPVLAHDPGETEQLALRLAKRMVWAVAPSHAADERIAIAAHKKLRQSQPDALLIVAPRFPDRRDAICTALDREVPMRSRGGTPGAGDAFWIMDTFGELGLVYRLSSAVLIGGTFDATEGHNPWEAAALNTAIMHGPHVANFAADYAQLAKIGGAIRVADEDALAAALVSADVERVARNAHTAIRDVSTATDQLSTDLLGLLGNRYG